MNTSQSISNKQTKTEWLNFLSHLSLRLAWSWLRQLCTLRLQLLTLIRRLHAILGWTVGKIRLEYAEATSNKRVMIGYVMMAVGASFYEAHLLFIHPAMPSPLAFINEIEVPIEVWYYKRWYYWFFTMRTEFLIIFGGIALFLRMPTKWGYRYMIAPVVAYMIAEIVYQSFYCTHYTHFYSWWTPERGVQYLIVVIVFGYAAFKALDYTAYRNYHLKDGTVCRLVGVIEMDLPWSEKEKSLKLLAKEFRDLNARY